MQYPNVWNSVFKNYSFQEQLWKKLANEVGEANMPALPSQEQWRGFEEGIFIYSQNSIAKETRKNYEIELKKVIDQVKKSKSGEEKKEWTQEKLAHTYAVENAVNLAGKIIGVAKFSHLNHGKDRIDPHPQYDTEIAGFNYVEFNEPIDFGQVKQDTQGTDVGVEGNIRQMKGEQREIARRNQMFRIMQQRGLTISAQQSELVGALIKASEGDLTGIQNWVNEHPDAKGEIYDSELHSQWQENNKEDQAKLIEQADNNLQQFLAPMSVGGFFNPQVWKGLSVVGKMISRGAKNFGGWAKQMISTLGEWIRPLLRPLWSSTNQMPNVFKEAGQKEINNAIDPDKKTDPVDQQKTKEKSQHPVGTLPSKTKGYNMNKEHPSVGDILAPTLEALREEFDVRRRGVISNEELVERAKRRATQLTDADILDLQAGDIKNAEEAQAIRIYVSDQMLKVIDEIGQNAEQTDPILIRDMSNELTRVMRMEMNLRAIATESGRVLQSFSIPMTQEIMDGFQRAVELMNKLDPNNEFGGQAVAKTLKDLSGQSKIEKKPSRFKRYWEMGRFIFLNWILQNPLTDMANIHGNLTNLSFHILANIGHPKDTIAMARGLRKGFKEGLSDAKEVLHGEREAISKFTEGSKVELPNVKDRSKKNLLKLAVPTTRLGMEDAFFRAMARNVETERMTSKLSRKLGVSPDEIYNSLSNLINDPKIEKYTRKEYVELAKYLEDIESELVFQKELGTVGKSFAKMSKVIYPIMPFVTTPANIIKFGVSWTPLGASKLLKKGLTNEEKNQIVRRAVAGTVLMSGIGAMVAQGVIEITGGGSDDAFERDLMAKLGYKPNHLYINTPFGKFGGSYMNINPINTMLQVMGDMLDKYRFNKFKSNPVDEKAWYDEVAEQMSDVALSIGQSVTDQSFLSGARDFMDYLAGRKPDWGSRMLTNFARVGSVQGVQRITGIEDRGRFETRGRLLEQAQKNFPLVSNEDLVESVSAFGEQRESQYERFPFPISEIEDNPVYEWVRDNGIRLSIPSRQTAIGNRQLSRFEYEWFAKKVGTAMDQVLQVLFEQQKDKTGEDKLTIEELQDKVDGAYAGVKKKVKKLLIDKLTKQNILKEGQ
jgi:hypothetical protein